MRGLKNKNTPMLKGCQIYHNYMRPHEGLKGKTPAEACGIKIEGDNKWITLIQNASQRPIVDKGSIAFYNLTESEKNNHFIIL